MTLEEWLRAGGPFYCADCGQHEKWHGKYWGSYLRRVMSTDHTFGEQTFAEWSAE